MKKLTLIQNFPLRARTDTVGPANPAAARTGIR